MIIINNMEKKCKLTKYTRFWLVVSLLLLGLLAYTPVYAEILWESGFYNSSSILDYENNIASNGYYFINDNQPIGVSGTVYGYAIYTPLSASEWISEISTGEQDSWGIWECPTQGYRGISGFCSNYTWHDGATTTASSDDNWVIATLHEPFVLDNEHYYYAGLHFGGYLNMTSVLTLGGNILMITFYNNNDGLGRYWVWLWRLYTDL